MFGVFLFLTYYLQQTLGFSPVATGLAFLPMTAVIMVSAVIGRHEAARRVRPAAARRHRDAARRGGMYYLTRLGVDSSYVDRHPARAA